MSVSATSPGSGPMDGACRFPITVCHNQAAADSRREQGVQQWQWQTAHTDQTQRCQGQDRGEKCPPSPAGRLDALPGEMAAVRSLMQNQNATRQRVQRTMRLLPPGSIVSPRAVRVYAHEYTAVYSPTVGNRLVGCVPMLVAQSVVRQVPKRPCQAEWAQKLLPGLRPHTQRASTTPRTSLHQLDCSGAISRRCCLSLQPEVCVSTVNSRNSGRPQPYDSKC